MDYRDDDLTNKGYCPHCGRNLGQLTKDARGWCELHGWVFADYTPPKETKE